MYQAMQMNLCAKVEEAPVMKDLYPLARLGPTSVGVGMVATGIGYNADAFKKMGLPEPDSWNVLTDQAPQGQAWRSSDHQHLWTACARDARSHERRRREEHRPRF